MKADDMNMTGSLARYHARAPRYSLNTSDNSLVRYSGAERFPWEERTELLNVSLTGLSFTAPKDISPQLGEIIKIQFEIPSAQMMACYAIVIRIEAIDESQNEIGVHFYKLDRLQRINLVQGLAHKLNLKQNQVKSKTEKEANELPQLPTVQQAFYLVFMLLTLFFWLLLLHYK